MGKTAFALNLATHAAMTQNKKCSRIQLRNECC